MPPAASDLGVSCREGPGFTLASPQHKAQSCPVWWGNPPSPPSLKGAILPVPPMAVASLLSPGSAGFGSLRLVGGGSRCDGRVEIFQDGVWGRVLDDQWDVQEASVVCRQLRCGEARTAYNPPKPERGMGPVVLRGVRCTGHEANLSLCNTSLPESVLVAGVAEDVGVICGVSGTAQAPPGDNLCRQTVPGSNWGLYPLQGVGGSCW